jgi:hypothetical protein
MIGQSEVVSTSSGSCWDHCIMWKFSILCPFAHYFKDVFHPKYNIEASLLLPVNLVLGLFSFQSKNKAALPMKQVGTMLDNHLQSVTKFELPIRHNYWLCLELASTFWKATALGQCTDDCCMWDDPKANGNVGMKKERTTARQAECNVQSLINQCVY